MRPPDPAFADPRLAVLYDVFDDDRSDLDTYVAIALEVGARHAVDIGCGTGTLALRLAELGVDVLGVDPAGASLEVARGKAGADHVTWLHGDATALIGRGLATDLVVMTGNVAQVFVSDDDWAQTLDAVHGSLRPGGWLAFETRRPEVRDWERWDIGPTTISLPAGLSAVVTRTVIESAPPLVTFETSVTVAGEMIPSSSTLRFRERDEVVVDLAGHGLEVVEVRDAPDRPGKELVFWLAASATDGRGPQRRSCSPRSRRCG